MLHTLSDLPDGGGVEVRVFAPFNSIEPGADVTPECKALVALFEEPEFLEGNNKF